MKKTTRSAHSIRKSMMISTAAIIVCLIGIIIEFASKKTFDTAGCLMISCNAVILSCYMEEYRKAREEEMPIITKM